MKLDSRAFTSKVARRAFVLFVGCALVPVTALAVLTFWRVTAELQEDAEERLQQTIKGAAMAAYHRLLAADAAMRAVAERGGSPTGPEMELFTGLLLVTADGQDRLLAGQMDRSPTLTPAQLTHLTTGKAVLSAEHTAPGHVRFFLSRALDPEHPERGVLHGAIAPAHLWAIQDEAGLPYSTKLLVLDESGRLLFSSFDAPSTLPEAITHQAGQRVAGHFEWDDGADQYIASYWSLFLQFGFLTPKWTFVLSQSKADIFAPIANFKRTFVLVVLLTVWMVLFLSVRQIRRSLTPLEQLKEGTQRLAMGDLDARVEVTSRDEFQDLAASFNRMASQLGRQFGALEMRREITAALNPTRSLDDTLQACARILTRRLDLAAVGVWLLSGDETTLELHASAEPSPRADEPPRILRSLPDLDRIARERRPYATSPLSADPRLRHLDGVADQPLVAFVAHPLIVDDRLVGLAAAFAAHPLDDMDLGGFAAVAGDLARYIDRKRVDDALQESETQLRQLQKMEAVGRLAGGIAHDFNNLLTVILGRSRLLLRGLAPDHPQRRAIQSIDETAERAALLTRQLLAFSRKQVLAPTILDLNEVVAGMTDILQRLIGESVELVVKPGPGIGTVKVDRGQIEQVIVNLVVNARDAMPQGGRITIETSRGERDGSDTREHTGDDPGSHVRLAVTDTGTGMDAHTRARIFEPFFTTKEPGKGTGLGLATVYGIVRQSGGSISVDSEPGAGSTFTISLPRIAEIATTADAPAAPPGRGSETVLVVEDEGEVRALVHTVLADHGYLVLSAGRPSDATRIAERHAGPIHLLVTDMVMPEMNGPVLARRLAGLRPEMAVLYMSGYTDQTPGEGTPFLQKPFTSDSVARAVRDVLDGLAPAMPATAEPA